MRRSLTTLVLFTALSGAVAASAAGCSVRTGGPPVAVRPSITVFPVELAGPARRDVAETAALMLEQRGLTEIEVAAAPFAAPENASFDDVAAAFGAAVRDAHLATDYALYAAVLGAPQRGVDETRIVLAARDGTIAWTDHQARGGDVLRQAHPRDPLECVFFLVERLHDPLDLLEPSESRSGRWAESWRAKSQVPTDAERAAMEARLQTLRTASPAPTVVVHPAHVGDAWSVESAQRLVDGLNARGLLRATLDETPLPFTVEASSNEQLVLWSAARSIQRLVRETPPRTDYVLVVDHLLRRDGEPARGVHTFLLDAKGEWVVVDFQNAHHEDYQRIEPMTAAACCDLSLQRLERAMRR